MMRNALALLFLALPAATQDPAASATDAVARFAAATELRTEDPAAASTAYREAAQQFEALIETESAHNEDIHFNAGNAWLLADDAGRAIYHYRQALRHAPDDAEVVTNLEEARTRRRDVIRQPAPVRPFGTLLFWHYDFSQPARAGLFLAAYLACCALAVAGCYSKRSELRWALAGCAATALLLAMSLGFEAARDARAPEGVILAAQVTVREGPGTTHAPALPVPLHAGAEFTQTATQGDWCAIALADGRAGWVPLSAVALLE